MGRATGNQPKKESWGEIFRTVVYALLIALVFRVLFFQPFNIPSGSMKSTLLIGDYLFVSKYAYGYSRHSFPFSPPLFEGRILQKEPERGDVIVFKNRFDNNSDYIKRLVGLPGDRLQVIAGVLHINGQAVDMKPDGEFIEEGPRGEPVRHQRFVETLPNGVSYKVLNSDNNTGPRDNTRVYEVPEGHYFMMGDNRDNSQDSRSLRYVGYIPAEYLVGRAEVIFLSAEDEYRPSRGDFVANPLKFWTWRFDRFFDLVE